MPVLTPTQVSPKFQIQAVSLPSDRLGDPSHRESFDQLLDLFQELCTTPAPPLGVLSEEEQKWLSKECLERFLVAEKWNVPGTFNRMQKSILWRRSRKLDDPSAMAKDLNGEAGIPSLFTFGVSKSGMPIHYMVPSLIRPRDEEIQVKRQMYNLERLYDQMPAGVEEVILIIDLSPPLNFSTASLRIFITALTQIQANHPERLGLCNIVNVGWKARMLINLCWPFVDVKSRERVMVDGDLVGEGLVGEDQLPRKYGGAKEFVYDRKEHFHDVLDTCLQRRAGEMLRWKAAGGTVGVSELDFKLPRTEKENLRFDLE